MNKLQSIHATALKLFVEYGFHGTPTAKIARDAGVANGTLFHYYKTKDDLVVGLYNTVKDELASSMSSIGHGTDFIIPKFRNIYTHTVRWAITNSDKFCYIQQFENSPHKGKIPVETIQQHSAVHIRLIDEAIKKKLLHTRPQELLLTLFNSQIFGVYQYLTSRDFEPHEQEKIITEGYEMIWDMLRFR